MKARRYAPCLPRASFFEMANVAATPMYSQGTRVAPAKRPRITLAFFLAHERVAEEVCWALVLTRFATSFIISGLTCAAMALRASDTYLARRATTLLSACTGAAERLAAAGGRGDGADAGLRELRVELLTHLRHEHTSLARDEPGHQLAHRRLRAGHGNARGLKQARGSGAVGGDDALGDGLGGHFCNPLVHAAAMRPSRAARVAV
mmetsp:Transcript_3019/g.9915  ORF Transcript_3019/g.9915 Transcript_3019/m.9915 type:complete len:206 (+) Transcript_3019:379-996(+)